MTNHYLQNFFHIYIYKQQKKNALSIAFNIYFISNNKKFYLSNSRKIIIITQLNKQTKNIIKNSINKFYNNKDKLKNFINKTFFYTIKYTQKNKSKVQYIIFYIKCNSILKKIQINNYKVLKIPNNTLNNLFKYQIGLPINYLDVKNSLNKINKWYVSNGYKWIKIEYSYKYNTIHLIIYEGFIDKIIIIDNFNSRYNKISTIDELIKNELLILTKKPININNLELYLKEMEKKYFLKELKYKLKYKSNKLVLIIQYDLRNYKKIQFKSNLIIQNFKNEIRLYSSYYHNIDKINFSYKNFIFLLNTLFNQYDINTLMFKYAINKKIINLYLQKIKNYSFKLFIYYQYSLMQYLVYDCYSNNIIFKNNKINRYSYLINLIKIETQIKLEIFKELTFTKSLINEYKYNYDNNFLLNNYMNNIKIKKFIKGKYLYLLNSKIESKYNGLSFIINKKQKITNKIQINYSKIIYLNINKLNIFHDFKDYIQIIKIKYNKHYKLPKILYKNNMLTFFIELYTKRGYFYKYILSKNNNKKIYNNIFIKIEYKLNIIGYNYIYFFINYRQNLLNINSCNYFNIKSGLGIQLEIPIKYIPSIRLELYTKNYTQFLLYFYKNSLLYL